MGQPSKLYCNLKIKENKILVVVVIEDFKSLSLACLGAF